MRSFLLLLVAVCVVGPARASAQKPTVVLAPPHVKGTLDDALLAGIVTEVESAFRALGWQVTGLDDSLRLPVPTPGPCNNNHCALDYAEAAHTAAALQLSIFGTSSVTFSLALVVPPGDAFVHGGAFSDPSRPREAITSAAGDLQEQHARGPGPWLVVTGTPIDAAVRLDGEVIGVVPLKRRISGGEHVLVVSAEGYEDHNDTIWLDNVAGALKEVSVNLQPASHGAGPASDPSRTDRLLVKPAPADWAIGGAATLAGLTYLVLGILHRSEDGECLQERGGMCVREAAPTHRSTIQLAGGASATALGLGWLFVSPFARWVSPSVSRTDASINFKAEF